MGAAVELIEPLLTYVDEDRNIHKRAQMLQLAKINGTVRVNSLAHDTACQLMLIQQTNSPLGPDRTDLYRLPAPILKKVDDQYRHDVIHVKGIKVESSEQQFQNFMMELGGSSTMIAEKKKRTNDISEENTKHSSTSLQ